MLREFFEYIRTHSKNKAYVEYMDGVELLSNRLDQMLPTLLESKHRGEWVGVWTDGGPIFGPNCANVVARL